MAVETRRVAKFAEDELEQVKTQARAASEAVAVSREAFEASLRPVLIDVPFSATTVTERVNYERTSYDVNPSAIHLVQTSDYLYCSVPLRNVGPGLGLMGDVRLRWSSGEDPWSGTPSVRAVPPNDQTRLRFSVPTRAAEHAGVEVALVKAGQFAIEADCVDVSNRVQPMTRLELLRNEQGNWETARIIFGVQE